MLPLSGKWASKLAAEPETGMGCQIAPILLKDGKRFGQVVIVGGNITQVRGVKASHFRKIKLNK
jgi:hypothetical protein